MSLVIVLLKVMTFLNYRIVTTHNLSSAFQRRLSSVLCKFSRKKLFHSGVTPGWCHRGRSPPPLVTPLMRRYINPRLSLLLSLAFLFRCRVYDGLVIRRNVKL